MIRSRGGVPGRREARAVAWRSRIMGVLIGALACGAAAPAIAAATSPPCPNDAFRTGASAVLPDCRAYEQVSPSEKGGFAAYSVQGLPAQPAFTGDTLGYMSFAAFPGAAGNTALFAGHIATRTGSGWVPSAELTPPVARAALLTSYLVNYVFSEDLTETVLELPLATLAPGAEEGPVNVYRRTPSGSYVLLNTAKPGVGFGEQCPALLEELCFLFVNVTAYAGSSEAYGHVLLESNGKLTPEGPAPEVAGLYENVGGQVRLVGIQPDGSPASTSAPGGGMSVEGWGPGEHRAAQRIENAISPDGSRIIFQAPADEGAPDPAQVGLTEVYDRIGGAQTIEISAPAPGAIPANSTPEPAQFWAASKTGSRVFFTSAAELTSQSNTGTANGGSDLYEYNTETRSLVDLTVDGNPADSENGAAVQGVVDASADGSYVYFVANGQLVPGKGVAGQPNLYVVHNEGAPEFIATLKGAESCVLNSAESADACDWTPFAADLEAYLTPDGTHLTFMSLAKIPSATFPEGYDNRDRNTGEADSEVYEYTAGGGGTSRELLCVSCEPSGAPPAGNALIGGITATTPPSQSQHEYTTASSLFYKVRAASDDGQRVFYTSPSGSSPQVYRVIEFERRGVGSCVAAGGCRFTISSKTNDSLEQYVGASPSGRDVFFATPSRLLPSDTDGQEDIYDAREGGGFALAAPSAPCEASCRAQGAAPSSGETLPSAVAGPSGNLVSAPPPTPAKCARNHRRVRGRCVLVKCPKQHRRVHGKCARVKGKAKKAAIGSRDGSGRGRS